jgi:molybdate transport system regulatory protein
MKSTPLIPKIRILIGAVVAIGPGKADLLAAISRTGSISAAAREMRMSYRRAWLLVDAMNLAFRRPLVETLTGGEGGGGARVTVMGEEVLRRYRVMESRAARSVAPELKRLSRLIARARRAR